VGEWQMARNRTAIRRLPSAIVWVAVIVVLAILMKAPAPHPAPNPPGAFSFAAMGDAPYYGWEELRYRLLRRELDAYDLRFTIHVGDIWWRPCSDAMYRKTKQQFDALRAPVYYTPGDNEWTDCWERGSGSYAPLERLQRLRQIFYSGRPVEFVENARWRHENIVFATVNMPGSFNAMQPFPKRTAADDEAAKRRTNAAAAWTRETFAEAKRTNARAVVIAFHGAPPFERIDPKYRQAYEPFMSALEDEARRFKRLVLVIHGDDHEYTVDHPQRDAPNLTRLEVPGSPDVGWVRVIVKGDSFAFEKHVVGTWKWW
jgi:hypothetical protein